MIFDFRFSIFDCLLARSLVHSLARRDQHGRDFIGFLQKGAHSLRRKQTCVNNHFEPEATLVGLFFHYACFINEIGARLRATKCTIIRGYRRSASHDLIRNGIATSIVWQTIRQFQDSKGKFFCSAFHLGFVHARS